MAPEPTRPTSAISRAVVRMSAWRIVDGLEPRSDSQGATDARVMRPRLRQPASRLRASQDSSSGRFRGA